MFKRLTAAAICVCALALPSLAQAQPSITRGIGGSVGILNTREEGTGLSLAGSFVLSMPFASLTIIPIDLGLMPHDPESQYQSETFDNGNTVCRDHDTGQFADKELCGPRLVYAASADFIAAIPIGNMRSLGLGGGYRVGNSPGAYAAGVFFAGPVHAKNWQVRARVGREFVELAVAAVYPFGGSPGTRR